uniref:PH domain-containing protein n=1 Tax=Photinus pyralis TaxID=7054 RepID=A0A1Y1KHY6_PHOPY
MENKKGSFANPRTSPASEPIVNESIPKHAHQHNTPPQHLRLLQYGLKIPNHQHTQINPSSHQHQPSPITPQPHLHHHRSQSPYQKHETNTPNIIQNQLFHQIHAHQYPQKQENQQGHYHYQTTNPSPYAHQHNVNQLHQQNAQIWVPHQPPTHYHPQQQQQAQKSEPQTPIQSSSPTSPQSKQKHLERKKVLGGATQSNRFPSVKRPTEAPVTIQGWLHKQGSEGLMLWKKRWFVLSEYCLFYYKGPGEEKLLGSILLPSYKVSICGPEDKVNRKYAFKCEHANMRTYLLAADTQELMMQWVRVLNMASLLQNTNDTEAHSQPSIPSQPTETTIIKQQVPNLRNTPTHIHSSSNTTDLSNPSQQELNQYSQPLYANAPPKPRRLTDGYSSPSLELLDRFSGETTKYVGVQKGQQYNVQPIYMTLSNSSSKSPINLYGNPQLHPEYISRTIQHQMYNKHLHIPDHAAVHLRENHNVERRTPDTYGRSKLNQTKSIHVSDYEDIYTDQSMYKRPLSPIAYTTTNNNRLNPSLSVPAVRPYTPINIHGPKTNLPYVPHQQLQQKVPNTIPRPHSADFLEYEVKYDNQNPIARRARPKSSLDINRHATNDNYFYTEEGYAEKMRKSAQYLPKMANVTGPQNEYQKWHPTYNKNESEFPPHHSTSRPINFNEVNQDFCQRELQPVRSRSVLSDGSLCKEVDMAMDPGVREHYEKEPVSPAFHSRHEVFGHLDDMHRSRDYEQFTRSASARLAQSNGQIEEKLLNREGKRKREESMKRLLEWKQRMLQSPLNRKVNQSVGKPASDKCNVYYRTNENGYPSSNVDMYSENRNPAPQYNSYSSDDEGTLFTSGSISITARDTFPRSVPTKKVWTPNLRPTQSKSITNLANKSYESEYGISHRPQQGTCYVPPVTSHPDISSDTSQSSNSRRANCQSGDKMNMSAGDLLGRTHEELVLLLIQLRRQSANNCKSIEACYNDIDNIQARLPQMDASKRLENLQKLEQIKQHLLELEKQYEKGKPLVNLVDNMVKLGSLYRFPKDNNNLPFMKDRLEFNQYIQERRLLAEERRDWNRLSPSQSELQTKVKQLYQLDRLIQEESETLQSLQHDKEEIERTLGGLRHRLIKGFKDPIEVEQARKQQIVLENELSRVHSMLAQNSRKLEETVAGNARLEQELLVLKQKLQLSKQQRSSPQISNAGDSLPCVIGTSAMLESDLHRVQQKVGDLQRQRQELSVQVRQLTDRSNSLQQLRISTNLPQQANQGNKKKVNLLWRETDLDTMKSFDHGESCDSSVTSNSITPLYINTNLKQNVESDFSTSSYKSNDSTSDENQNQNLFPQEKQEIKTVRIVKRESERRQRDREKVCTGKWDIVNEEEDSSQSSSTIFRPTSIQKTQSSATLERLDSDQSTSGVLSRQSSLSQPSLPQLPSDIRSPLNVSADKLSELSPIFKSESAKQIIMEMATQDTVKHSNRRIVPKEKRRHYTAPHNNLLMKSLNHLPTDNKDFDSLNIRRARDDLDMERALRQRIDAPDVVRSTLSNKELKYNESTIDNILGTPNKIIIPERYVPEQLPQLTAEEQQYRLRKVESIKKMLSDTTIISGSSPNLAAEETNSEHSSSSATNKTSKIIEEKKQREHLLQLNQILAKQVMEMSKIVAGSNTPGE